MIARFLFMVFIILLAGCCGPAKWAEEVVGQANCGMTIAEVQALTNKYLQEMEVPRDWMTHLIRDDETDLWLGFENGKLRFIQVAWMQKMMKVATYQRVDLCHGLPLNTEGD